MSLNFFGVCVRSLNSNQGFLELQERRAEVEASHHSQPWSVTALSVTLKLLPDLNKENLTVTVPIHQEVP